MLWVIAVYLFACVDQTFQAPLCVPTFSEGRKGNPEIGGYIYFECEISTCKHLTKIVFEKTGLGPKWTPILEGINKTQFKALDAVAEYSIENRNDYSGFRTKHTLNIDPLILQDHGKWRCVVYDAKFGEYKSRPIDFHIYVPPVDGAFFIKPNSSHLVKNQQKEFTCVVDGIYPDPDMFWEVNGVKNNGLFTRQQREDQFWFVKNTIQIMFDTVGVNTLNCVIRARERDPWLEKHTNFTLQEPAIVLYPQHDIHVTAEVAATFSLTCRGSGYKPRIIWDRDGEVIHVNDTRYIIEETCDYSQCEGSISSISIDPELVCANEDQYTGAYTCIITLEPPYQSSTSSTNMNVAISKRQCREENLGHIVGFSMLPVVCLMVISFGIWQKVHQKKQKQFSGEPLLIKEPDIEFYKSMELKDETKLKYNTTNKLLLCGQEQYDDTLVFFEFNTGRVFIHDISDFDKYTEYKCKVMIWDMVCTSRNKFVVIERDTQAIHLLHLRGKTFHTIDTMSKVKDSSSILICRESDTSFLTCNLQKKFKVSDDNESIGADRNKISISRVDVNNKLKPEHLKSVTMNNVPQFISYSADNAKLILLNFFGTLYNLDLKSSDNVSFKLKKEYLQKHVGSLYTNNHVSIYGGFDGKIDLRMFDTHHSVMQDVGKPVNGITMRNMRMIVCCGNEGEEQHIKVFSAKRSD